MLKPVRVTPEGHARLQASLEQERQRLEEATQILRDLIGNADEEDDAGLEDAKREKARIEQRIDELDDQLARAEIIREYSRDVADLGACITLQDPEADEEFEVQLVSPVEAEVAESAIPRISDASPLGKALLGRKVGESFTVSIGRRHMHYHIIAIR